MASFIALAIASAVLVQSATVTTYCGVALATPTPSKTICGKYGTLTAPANAGYTYAADRNQCATMCLSWNECAAIGYRQDNLICNIYTKPLANQGFRTVTSGTPTDAATMYGRGCFTSTCFTQTPTPTPSPPTGPLPLPVGPCPLKVFFSDDSALVGKYIRSANTAPKKQANVLVDVTDKASAPLFTVQKGNLLKAGVRVAMQDEAAGNPANGPTDANGDQVAYGLVHLVPNSLAAGQRGLNCSVIDSSFNGASVPKALWCTNFNGALEVFTIAGAAKQLGLASNIPKGQVQVGVHLDC